MKEKDLFGFSFYSLFGAWKLVGINHQDERRRYLAGYLISLYWYAACNNCQGFVCVLQLYRKDVRRLALTHTLIQRATVHSQAGMVSFHDFSSFFVVFVCLFVLQSV